MSVKIGFDNFADFSDDTPIKQALAGFRKIEDGYQAMIAAVEDSNVQLAEDMTEVQKAAMTIQDSMKGLNLSLEKNQNFLAETAGSSENLVKEYNALKTIQDDNAKTIATLQKQLEKMTTTREESQKHTKNEANSLNDLNKQLKEAEAEYKRLGDATDEATKGQAIEKVKALTYEYKAQDAVLKEAKKGILVAAGSYNELNRQVIESKKRLKEMDGGLEGTSQEFKDLKKFVTDGTVKLKAWDKEIGDHGREVGNYAKATEGLGNAFGQVGGGQITQVVGQVKQVNAALLTLAANPIGIILLAIGAAIGALTAYFKSGTEGEDDFNTALQVGKAILETLLDVVEAVGKALFEAITEPKKLWEGFLNLIQPLTDKLKAMWDEPGKAAKEFGKLIWENVINRFKAIGVAYEGLSKVFKGDFAGGLKQLSNAALQSVTGITNLVDKITDVAQSAADKLKEIADAANKELQIRIALGLKIAALENQLRKDRIADILDDAQTELKAERLLLESKDKLRFADEVRYNKLRQANKLLEEQLEGDLKLARDEIALQQLVIQQSGDTYEARQKLVELQAAEINLQKSFLQARKRRQQAEIALIREIEKDMIDSAKRIADAQNNLDTFRLNETVRLNQKILAEETSSLNDRLAAIADMDSAQEDLLKIGMQRQLDVSKEAALARIELDGDTLDTIYNNESISIAARIAQERTAKEQLLASDKAYVDETTKITEEYAARSAQLLEDTKKLAEDNVFKVLDRDAAIFAANMGETFDGVQDALNNSFLDGEINAKEYQKRLVQIQQDGNNALIAQQIDYLKQRSALLKEGTKERAETEKKIADLELQLSKTSVDQRLAYEKDLNQALKDLGNGIVQGAMQVISDRRAAEDADREARLTAIGEAEQKQLSLVKDSEQAQALVKANFAAQKKKIDDEQKQANRKRAIFDKALAITEIAINTAKGVSQALGAYPPPASFILAGVVAALGAVQIATVASKPIPAFAEGTEYAPRGLAIVNELGPELIIDKFGKPRVVNTDGPAFTMLKGGERIIPADKTAKFLEYENMVNGSAVLRGGIETVQQITALSMDKVVSAIFTGNQQVVAAIGSMPRDVYDEKGYRIYERTTNGRVTYLGNKHKLFN